MKIDTFLSLDISKKEHKRLTLEYLRNLIPANCWLVNDSWFRPIDHPRGDYMGDEVFRKAKEKEILAAKLLDILENETN